MITRLLFTLMAVALLMPVSASAGEMKDSLHALFAKGIRHQGAIAELIEVSRWPNTHGAVIWKVPHISRHSSRMSLIAEQGSGAQKRRWYVPVRVHWWADAVVVRQEAQVRSRLLADMLEVKRVDVAGHIGVWWSRPADLAGMQVIRPLHKGDVVYSSSVKQPPLIRRGDRVTIVARIGAIAVHAEGRALRSGSRGDRLLVQNLRSKQTVQATIEDAHTVIVPSGGAG